MEKEVIQELLKIKIMKSKLDIIIVIQERFMQDMKEDLLALMDYKYLIEF